MFNKDLKKIYDAIYRKGEKRHYSKNLFSQSAPLQVMEPLKELNWKGKDVLDVGCGTGLFSHLVKGKGAKKVTGVDYSKEAIALAKKKYGEEGIEFLCEDFTKIRGKYDAVVSLGTFEHLDNPLSTLKHFKGLLKKNGSIIIVSPNWTNPRGYALLTLYYLFNAKITLADRHYLTPIEFIGWSKAIGMKLNFRTFDYDWGFGEKMIKDFKRRLPRVLPGNRNVKKFIAWLKNHVPSVETPSKFNGALGLYRFR